MSSPAEEEKEAQNTTEIVESECNFYARKMYEVDPKCKLNDFN